MEIKEITKTITKTVYIAEDGSEHNSSCACENYELEKEINDLEKECDEKLRIYTKNSNYPSMVNLRYEREYKLFLIKDEQDLDLFVKTYSHWFNNLEERWEVDKELFIYPDVLCVLDFPRGGDEHRLYKITQLWNQFNVFMNELEEEIQLKLNPKK